MQYIHFSIFTFCGQHLDKGDHFLWLFDAFFGILWFVLGLCLHMNRLQ